METIAMTTASSERQSKQQKEVGDGLLPELKEQKEKGGQRLQKTTKDVLSVEDSYRANELQRQVEAEITAVSKLTHRLVSKLMCKPTSDKLYKEDLIRQ